MTNLPQINAKLKPILHTFQGSINGETQLLVNARELHAFLEGKQECAHWIGKRIEKYGFVEGSDYLIDKIIIQLPSGTKYKTDYHLSLDMAKELSMVQRNAKGKQARQYFIACEKALIGDVGQLHALTAQNQVLTTRPNRPKPSPKRRTVKSQQRLQGITSNARWWTGKLANGACGWASAKHG